MEAVVFTSGRPHTTAAVTRGAARLFVNLGYAPLLEVRLPNGRRADILALGPKGQIAIVEVKSGVEDFRTDQKWGEYLPFCDAFFFAVSPEFPLDVLPGIPGLVVADQFDGAVVREAPVARLAGARRKALTLAFARLAATRALGLPELEALSADPGSRATLSTQPRTAIEGIYSPD
jgi:hypothetical protein